MRIILRGIFYLQITVHIFIEEGDYMTNICEFND